MRQKTIITKLLQSVTEVYYKVRQVLQSVTDCYYKVRQVLQSVTGCYYKVRRNTWNVQLIMQLITVNICKYNIKFRQWSKDASWI